MMRQLYIVLATAWVIGAVVFILNTTVFSREISIQEYSFLYFRMHEDVTIPHNVKQQAEKLIREYLTDGLISVDEYRLIEDVLNEKHKQDIEDREYKNLFFKEYNDGN